MNTDLLKGYTPFNNRMLYLICNTDLSGSEFRVLLTILRHTAGYHRQSHELSGGFISKGTGLPMRTVWSAIKKLRKRNIVTVISTGGKSNVIALNENYLALNSEDFCNSADFCSEQNCISISAEFCTTGSEENCTQERYREKYKDREGTPTLDDVISYCQQMSFTFSPDRFFNYYEAIGWQKNGQPIMNWKAVARNWQARERTQPVQEEVKKDDWGRPIPPEFV